MEEKKNDRVNRKGFLIFLAWYFLALAAAVAYSIYFRLGEDRLFLAVASVVAWTIFAGKRFHDLGKSAWSVLLLLIPLINLVMLLVLIFAKGEEGENQYGMPLP